MEEVEVEVGAQGELRVSLRWSRDINIAHYLHTLHQTQPSFPLLCGLM